VSAVWQERLRNAWSNLANTPPQARAYRTRTLAPNCPLDAYAALRAIDDSPCLLIRCDAPDGSLFELGGMRLSVDRDEQGTLLVVSLEDRAQRDLFATLCADAVSAAGAESAQALSRFHARLNAWRRFLRDSRSGLSREEVIGLVGELIILERLLMLHGNLINSWKSPDDALHDFEQSGHALEVKTSHGPTSRIRISTLDQLDVSGLRRLDLIHVRLFDDPEGRSLGNIIDTLSAHLPDECFRQNFANALLRRGLNPDDEAARNSLRASLRSIDTYSVDGPFPRLLRSSVPLAIAEASYALELRAIADHTADTGTVLSLFAAGGAA
jgi:hypothetical protein